MTRLSTEGCGRQNVVVGRRMAGSLGGEPGHVQRALAGTVMAQVL
jgi:hypothetical protein